jgi:hypothetical protein
MLMLRAFAFENVCAICAVDMAALAAGKLINRLPVICAWLPGISYNNLPVSVYESHML